MANRRASQVEARPFRGQARVTADVAGTPMLSGEDFKQVARQFGSLEALFSADADKAATREGEQEGYSAALDGGTPRMSGTIRDEAYDKTLVQTKVSLLSSEISDRLRVAYGENMRDPDGFQRAAVAFGEEMKARPDLQTFFAVPQFRASVVTAFDRLKTGFGVKVQDNAKTYADEQAAATASAAIDASQRASDRMAAGGDNPATARALADENAKRKAMRANEEREGRMTPEKRRLADQADDDQDRVNIIAGRFDKIAGVDAMVAEKEKLAREYKAGEGAAGGLSGDQFRRLEQAVDGKIRQAAIEEQRGSAALGKSLDSIERRASQGFTIAAEEMAQARQLARSVPDGETRVADSKFAVEQYAAWRMKTPEEMALIAHGLRQQAQKAGASEADVKRVERAEAMQARIAKNVEGNALGWAGETGLLTVKPLDFSSPEAMSASMKERIAAVEAAAKHYRLRTPQYFTAPERAIIAQRVGSKGEEMIRFGATLSREWGRAASVAAMREISENDGVTGFAGGLLASGGSPGIARDVADYNELARTGVKLTPPTPAKMDDFMRETIGPALKALPATERNVREMAERRYQVVGRGRFDGGIDRSNRPMMEETIHGSVGGTKIGNRDYGGFAVVNGTKTVVPMDVARGSFQRMLGQVAQDDLPDGMYDRDGKEKKVSTLANARLRAVGGNKYEVYFGDPDGADPQPALTKGGTVYRLDWDAVERKLRGRLDPSFFRAPRS